MHVGWGISLGPHRELECQLVPGPHQYTTVVVMSPQDNFVLALLTVGCGTDSRASTHTCVSVPSSSGVSNDTTDESAEIPSALCVVGSAAQGGVDETRILLMCVCVRGCYYLQALL